MFVKDLNRLEKEMNMTDFYLNKVLPVTSFTQMMTTLRTVTDDEDQLKKLQSIQKEFFKNLCPNRDDTTESIVESKLDEENSLGAGDQKALSEGNEAQSRKPSFGSDLDKKDLDLYSPKYRQVIEEFRKLKHDSL